MDLEIKQKLTSNWFKSLQEMFCKTISDFEKNKISFKSTSWKRNLKKDEGGGEYRILKDGKIFDKVGVNFSKVYGKFPKEFQKNIPGVSKDPRFWASGISIVMHMQNPHIPAMHLILDIFVRLLIGSVEVLMLLHQKKIIKKKNSFTKLLEICAIDMTKIIIKNIKNGVMNIFIYLIEKSPGE